MLVDRRRYSEDNYVYLLVEGDSAALIDPGDASVAIALAGAHGVRPQAILHTHGHADHTGGTAEVKEAFGAVVHGHRGDAPLYPPDVGVDVDVAGRDWLELGALRIRVHPAPGHTPGSVLYAWQGRLFTGDTIFWGGVGRCKYGDPEELAQTCSQEVARLDGALEVDPGHDYAENNLSFALELEPGNLAARQVLAEARAARAAGQEPRPTSLARERAVNPFLRPAAPAILDALEGRTGVRPRGAQEAFVALRRLKDDWQYRPAPQ
jgi:hydroxyacylglutathione hydrolase